MWESKLLRLQARGKRVAALENKPELSEDLGIYLQAYERLKNACTPGGRITFSEMLAYCEIFGVVDTEDFVDTIQLIEQTIEKLNSKEDSTNDGADGNTASSSRSEQRGPRKSERIGRHPEDGSRCRLIDDKAATPE